METGETILIAEPGASMASGLSPFLKDSGLSVVQVSTLRETLMTLQRRRIDVLVMDAELLEKDFEFLSIIKGMEEDLPIILCAEFNTPEIESKVRQQRVFFYHIKSFGNQDLQMAIHNAIHKSFYY